MKVEGWWHPTCETANRAPFVPSGGCSQAPGNNFERLSTIYRAIFRICPADLLIFSIIRHLIAANVSL
jgi:hypothetical protein